jgi:hypothetical protein
VEISHSALRAPAGMSSSGRNPWRPVILERLLSASDPFVLFHASPIPQTQERRPCKEVSSNPLAGAQIAAPQSLLESPIEFVDRFIAEWMEKFGSWRTVAPVPAAGASGGTAPAQGGAQ